MPDSAASRKPRRRQISADADAVLAACRLLVGISIRSLATVEDVVTVMQLRILTVIASRQEVTLSALAVATGMHVSRASRACDRMVAEGLLEREDDPDDRRSLRLTLTDHGHQLVSDVAAARRAAVEPALRRMSASRRAELVATLHEFAAAGGEPDEADLWSLGWAT